MGNASYQQYGDASLLALEYMFAQCTLPKVVVVPCNHDKPEFLIHLNSAPFSRIFCFTIIY